MNLVQSFLTNVQRSYLSFAHDTPLPSLTERATFQTIFVHTIPNGWVPFSPSKTNSAAGTSTEVSSVRLNVLSWNVDSSAPKSRERLQALLEYLRTEESLAVDIIALQEVHYYAIPALVESSWVQRHFFLTDTDSSHWRDGSKFGSITMIRRNSKWMPRVTYRTTLPSHMGRDALYTDLFIHMDTSSVMLRIINVHLDSLPIDPSFRPAQLEICASHIRVLGKGIVVGDFNAVTDRDLNIAREVGLQDAWIECHGEDVQGHTWGVQREEMFPPSRLDRAVALGLRAEDVRVLPCGTVADLEDQGYWSDHCGLWSSFGVESF